MDADATGSIPSPVIQKVQPLIWLITNDFMTIQSMTRILSAAGYAVQAVDAHLREGIEQLGESQQWPRLVLMLDADEPGQAMPGNYSYEGLISCLNKHSGHAPIISLSSNAEFHRELTELGATASVAALTPLLAGEPDAVAAFTGQVKELVAKERVVKTMIGQTEIRHRILPPLGEYRL